MIARLTLLLSFILTLGLAGCGDLPAPFMGNPGATAKRLAQPLTPILAVAPPTQALLTDAAARAFAEALAESLADIEVPAIARVPRKDDWRLDTVAEQRGDSVVPRYTVRNPKGEDQGSVEGPLVKLPDWYSSSPALLRKVALDSTSKISSLLTSIRIAHDMADPNSLYNRPAKVAVLDVTGAPGDGNIALSRHMRDQLAKYGPLVQTDAHGADFIVQGEVKVVPIPVRQERVEIQWYVKTPGGDERGRVVQLNEIPAGTLAGFWGDVAVVVAGEAAPGVNDVLIRQSGKDPNANRKAEAAPVGPAAASPAQGTGAAQPSPAQPSPAQPAPAQPALGQRKAPPPPR